MFTRLITLSAAALVVAGCSIDSDVDGTVDTSNADTSVTDTATDASAEEDAADGLVDAPEDALTDVVADGSGDASDADGSGEADGSGDAGVEVDGSGDAEGDAHDHDAHDHDAEAGHEAGDATEGDTDMVDYSCPAGSERPLGTCETDPGFGSSECTSAAHIDEPIPISYSASPPSCDDHRPQWARWGAYEFLPPQRWLHNLEHGGIAFLHHPCAPADAVAEVRAYAAGRAADDGGEFRWVQTPAPGLLSNFALVAWGEVMLLDCPSSDAADAFITEHYRQAPEDVASDGSFDRLWLGRDAGE